MTTPAMPVRATVPITTTSIPFASTNEQSLRPVRHTRIHGYILEPLCTRLYEARQASSSLRRVVSMNGLLIGNTAERVLRKLPCSVLAVKPDGFVCPVGLDAVSPPSD